MAYKVFISSTSKDMELAQDLARRLETVGAKVFPVEKSATSGEHIETSINRGLRDADEVIVILTNNSMHSPGLMSELGAAYSLGKRVIPVALGVDANELPHIINQKDCIKWPDLPRYISSLEKRVKDS
jgi:nucleoside 2-deoxyribosyltransferase